MINFAFGSYKLKFKIIYDFFIFSRFLKDYKTKIVYTVEFPSKFGYFNKFLQDVDQTLLFLVDNGESIAVIAC